MSLLTRVTFLTTASVSKDRYTAMTAQVGTLTAPALTLTRMIPAPPFQIEVGGVTKQIYAINGSTDLSIFTDPQGRLHMQPGDTVTYRLQYQMPTSEFESFRLDDYLPLPAHDAGEMTITTVNTTESSHTSCSRLGIPASRRHLFRDVHF